MSEAFDERRHGTERRRHDAEAPAVEQRQDAERRQFPVLAGENDGGEVVVQVRHTIDQYKRQHNLKRISLPKLLAIARGLGFRKADTPW